jgi:hypothetical protein
MANRSSLKGAGMIPRNSPLTTGPLVFDDFDRIDVTGLFEVLSRLPNTRLPARPVPRADPRRERTSDRARSRSRRRAGAPACSTCQVVLVKKG